MVIKMKFFKLTFPNCFPFSISQTYQSLIKQWTQHCTCWPVYQRPYYLPRSFNLLHFPLLKKLAALLSPFLTLNENTNLRLALSRISEMYSPVSIMAMNRFRIKFSRATQDFSFFSKHISYPKHSFRTVFSCRIQCNDILNQKVESSRPNKSHYLIFYAYHSSVQ